jgi:tRNA-uridine 2-sulfurtransferase
VGKKGACCAGQDVRDAANVAAKLGIPHYVLDYEARFSQAVIEDFADSYGRGETPIPCIRCNERVKFRDLLQTSRDLGASALATGHYARRLRGDDGPALYRAADDSRDQSYFLYRTTRDELDFLRFPLGGMAKDATRALARELDLPVADKPDSQDICFVPQGSYADIVTRLRPEAGEPGDIVDEAGNVLGRHRGIAHFTVGQRKGIGIAAAAPLYVLRLDPARRRVVVGPHSALAQTAVRLAEVNWLGPELAPGEAVAVSAKLRSAQAPVPATLHAGDADGAELVLGAPAGAVAPGQAAVLYDGDRLLGGGWIRRDP